MQLPLSVGHLEIIADRKVNLPACPPNPLPSPEHYYFQLPRPLLAHDFQCDLHGKSRSILVKSRLSRPNEISESHN